MRMDIKRKEDPHLAKPALSTPVAKRPKRSKDQRLNLKRSYEAFLETTRKAGASARSACIPSEAWPMRPYAASI